MGYYDFSPKMMEKEQKEGLEGGMSSRYSEVSGDAGRVCDGGETEPLQRRENHANSRGTKHKEMSMTIDGNSQKPWPWEMGSSKRLPGAIFNMADRSRLWQGAEEKAEGQMETTLATAVYFPKTLPHLTV